MVVFTKAIFKNLIIMNNPHHGVTDRVVALCRLGTLELLPRELFETILGFLDARTLCTARLVCHRFYFAASQFVHALRLTGDHLQWLHETPPPFRNFPNVGRLTVSDIGEQDICALYHPDVVDAVTHLSIAS
jgi:hypothetical protein